MCFVNENGHHHKINIKIDKDFYGINTSIPIEKKSQNGQQINDGCHLEGIGVFGLDQIYLLTMMMCSIISYIRMDLHKAAQVLHTELDLHNTSPRVQNKTAGFHASPTPGTPDCHISTPLSHSPVRPRPVSVHKQSASPSTNWQDHVLSQSSQRPSPKFNCKSMNHSTTFKDMDSCSHSIKSPQPKNISRTPTFPTSSPFSATSPKSR